MGNCVRGCRRLGRGHRSLAEDFAEYNFNGAICTHGFGGYTEFHHQAWHGKTEFVESQLKDPKFEFDSPTNDLNTPFALATHGGHLEVFEILLERGANVNNADHEKDTPLHYAVKNESYEMTIKLIEHGAKVNVRNTYDTTPLWLAAYKGNARILRLLLFNNAEMSVAATGRRLVEYYEGPMYSDPRTPLYVAVDRGATDCVRSLLHAGCEVHKEKWLLEADYPKGYADDRGDESCDGCSDDDDEDYDEDAKTKQREAKKETLAETIQMLRELVSRPPTLLAICRTFLRQRFGKQLGCVISDFELPNSLKEYLTLADFDPNRSNLTLNKK